MAEIKQLFAYLRVSGRSQVDKGGFDRQIKAIKAFCEHQGYTISHKYREEGVSGTKDELDRPAFQDMITAILSDGIKTIIVESLDRLARELRIQEQILMYLARKDISLISANTGENVTRAILSDPMKKALIQMQGVFAELDKSQLVRKLKRGREKARQDRGKCEGRKHYGEESEQERAVIKRITYMRRLSRGQQKRMSFQTIADALNDKNIKTRLGKNWTATGVKNVIDKNWLTRK
jgi:DNA invertase Pin-like site-specific DNA recombinase